MKHFLLSIFIVLKLCIVNAQGTTEIEYEYMVTGYHKSVKKGRRLKAGYYIEEQKPFVRRNVIILATHLHRNDSTLAGIILEIASTDSEGSVKNYYGIPAVQLEDKGSFGWDLFYDDLATMTCEVRYYLLAWMSYQLACENHS